MPVPRNSGQTAGPSTTPAPIRGLNFKDSLAAMDPTDALVLDNFVCRPSYVEIRKGWEEHVTGFSADVETLMPFSAADGTQFLFAAAGTGIYDVTAAGAVGAAVVTGVTSAYWNFAVVNNVAGNTLIAVNGADPGQTFNGTVWAAWSITGVASDDLTSVLVWKRRTWAVERNTMTGWYSAIDAIAGAMTSFNFGAIFQRGGYLVSLLTWTVDGGAGIDDILVAVTSEGEAALFQGTDPASASTFALQGIYYIGKPVGKRYYAKLGGDLLLLTAGGLVALSRYLQSATLNSTSVVSDRIQRQLALDIISFGAVQGWEVVVYFEDNLLLVQVPGGSIGNRYQYMMNTITGAWSRTLLADAITWGISDGQLYAGHSSLVSNSWTGGTDNGEAITYTMIPAFSYFGSPTQGKRFTLGRLTIQSDYTPSFYTKLLRDFDTQFTFPAIVPAPANGAVWGTAIWGQDVWGGLSSFYRRWYGLNGYCYAGTIVMYGAHLGTMLRVVAEDYVFETSQGTVL